MNIDPVREWQIATVTSVNDESPRVKLFKLDLANETKFRAGQYFDIRLTAPDGYQAQRSYSVTSSPEDSNSIELAIELIADGEVSAYFHEIVKPDDQIELRGPIGGHFTLSPNFTKPVLLVAGGSGIAPIISMLRHRRSSTRIAPTVLMFSVRTEADALFAQELEDMAQENPNLHIIIALTRSESETPDSKQRETRRIDRSMIDSAITKLAEQPARAYVCGGTDFVESIGNHLLDIGLAFHDIRTERFGP